MGKVERLSLEQLTALLRAARARRERDWILFLVTFWHGLRASEIVGPKGLTAGNFDFSGSEPYLRVKRGKDSDATQHPLFQHGDQLLDEARAVEAYLRSAPSGRLFPISRRQFHRLMRQHGRSAGIPQHLCHPHVLKHTCAKYLMNELGLPINVVQAHIGHKSLSSTSVYLKLSGEEASHAIREALRKGPQQRSLF